MKSRIQSLNSLTRVSEVRVVGMKVALEKVGYKPEEAMKLSREAFQVFHHWRHEIELFSGAETMLEALSEKYTLAVITNGNADVNALGLGHYFQFSVSAEDLNRSKPDPVVFRHALELAGVEADQAVHVGDNLVTDVQGAASVGMRTIWFNPEGKSLESEDCPEAIQPNDIVERLEQIPLAIEGSYLHL